jgi:hypothetical protein
MPVSKLSPVAECAVGPALRQVTVSPTSTVIEAGANWKSLIVTPPDAAALAIASGALSRGFSTGRVSTTWLGSGWG